MSANAEDKEVRRVIAQLLMKASEIWRRPTMPGLPVRPIRVLYTDTPEMSASDWQEREGDLRATAREVLASVNGIAACVDKPECVRVDISPIVRFCTELPTPQRYTAVLVFVRGNVTPMRVIVVPAEEKVHSKPRASKERSE